MAVRVQDKREYYSHEERSRATIAISNCTAPAYYTRGGIDTLGSGPSIFYQMAISAH